MKKIKKTLALLCCAVLLVVISVGATIAYLTDTDDVKNTFTVGHVDITLDETDFDNSSDEDRDRENAYHLVPGESYLKDPIVHVKANSENSWIFVKVENGIDGIENPNLTIESQIEDWGWTALEGYSGVYYKEYTKSATDVDLTVFTTIAIDSAVDNAKLQEYAGANVKVTAYAIQMSGFEGKPVEAWEAGEINTWTEYTHVVEETPEEETPEEGTEG